VPGCKEILHAGLLAREKGLSFLVDFQTRAHRSFRKRPSEYIGAISENRPWRRCFITPGGRRPTSPSREWTRDRRG
jgi:hypothetical protein